MSKYLYNGISLLDINTVWTDKTTDPYAIIFVDENGRIVLHISPAPFIYEDPNVNISSGSGSPKYLYDSSGWVEDGTGSGYTGSGVKWTNYDIIDISDNSVYLAASEPVPDNGDFDLKSWLIGFALGLAGKPVPFAKNEPLVEPVAYLYGTPSESGNIGLRVGDTVTYYAGAVLSKLPEMAYQYAAIVPNASAPYDGYAYNLWNFSAPLYISNATNNGNASGRTRVYTEKGASYKSWKGNPDGKAWDFTNENSSSTGSVTTEMPIWTNEDIYAEIDGNRSLYIAASDPIPVGEIVDYNGEIPIYEVIT